MIRVFGSINLDLVARVPQLPRAGQTLHGRGLAMSPGGKGANQALAARRAGADVALIGAVGRDAFAEPALALLRQDGVDLSAVETVDDATGVALIHVDDAGENAITVIAGANARVPGAQVPDAALDASTILVMQLETPPAAGLDLAQRARRNGARVVLNAAPAAPLDEAWWQALDVLVVNEHEAVALAQSLGIDGEPAAFADEVSTRFGIATVVTLGARGAIAGVGDDRYRVPALNIHCVDTVGAGDAFVGTLAAALDRRERWTTALARASAAGSLACTQPGAQSALPRADVIASAAATLESAIDITSR